MDREAPAKRSSIRTAKLRLVVVAAENLDPKVRREKCIYCGSASEAHHRQSSLYDGCLVLRLHARDDAHVPKRRLDSDIFEARLTQHFRKLASRVLPSRRPSEHDHCVGSGRERAGLVLVVKHLVHDEPSARIKTVEALAAQEAALVGRPVVVDVGIEVDVRRWKWIVLHVANVCADPILQSDLLADFVRNLAHRRNIKYGRLQLGVATENSIWSGLRSAMRVKLDR
jgi:hypothetical protein